jgi:hypothetical protein
MLSISQQVESLPFIGNIWKYYRIKKEEFDYIRGKATYMAEYKMWWDYVVRMIAPDSIEILRDVILIDKLKVRVYIVGQSQGTTEGFRAEKAFKMMKDVRDIKVPGAAIYISHSFIPIPTMEAQNMLRGALFYNGESQHNFKKGNELNQEDVDLSLDRNDLAKCVELLHYNKERMLYGNYIVTIYARDDKSLKISSSKVEHAIKGNDVLAAIPVNQMWEAFMSGQPYPWIEDFTTIRMFSTFAAMISPTVSPFSALSDGDIGEFYIGDEIGTSRNVFLSPFSGLPAPHILIAGATGGGKTYLEMKMMIAYRLLGRIVWYLTKKRDEDTHYENVAEYMMGKVIEVGDGPGKYSINPLQFICSFGIEDIPEHVAIKIYNTQKEFASRFISRWLQKEYNHRMDNFVDKCLDILYDKFGISKTDSKTWKDKTFPVMGDLYDEMVKQMPTLERDDKRTCASMLAKMYKIKHGGTFDFINRQTNVDWSLKFGIINIVDVPEELNEPMNILISGILSWQLRSANGEGVSIFIDEGGSFLREPDLASLLFKGITQWRSQGGQIVLAIHQTEDAKVSNMSEVIQTNCFIQIAFGANLNDKTSKYIQDFFGLPDNYAKMLTKLGQGQCVVRVQNSLGAVQIIADDDVHKLIKGYKLTDHTEDVQVIEEVKETVPYVIKEKYNQLVKENKFMLESWMSHFTVKGLEDAGYTLYNNIQRTLDNGKVRAWVHHDIIKKKEVTGEPTDYFELPDEEAISKEQKTKEYFEQQTPDHYATACQLAAFWIDEGLENVKVNHWNKVDVEGELFGETYAAEFERDGTHSIESIQKKFNRAKTMYDHVWIVHTSLNASKVRKAVDTPTKKNSIQRGSGLKDLFEQVFAEARKKHQKAQQEEVSSNSLGHIEYKEKQEEKAQQEKVSEQNPKKSKQDVREETTDSKKTLDQEQERTLQTEA